MRITRSIGLLLILTVALASPGHAVETDSTYDTTAPTGTNVPNWDTGWTQPTNETEGTYLTGWDYVGQVNGLSATYLGDGWVLTAAHVGTGNFTLGSETYGILTNSIQDISANGSQVDLVLFQINTTSLDNSTTLNLPALTLSTNDPTAFAEGTPGSSVVLIGYGGGQGETWGFNTVTQVNEEVTPEGYNYVSNDFLTALGTVTYGSQSITNHAQLVSGDSGGGDFIYNAATGQWELSGINEVVGEGDVGPGGEEEYVSGFVQLDTYTPEISADMLSAVPEPPVPLLLGLGFALLWGINRSKRQPS